MICHIIDTSKINGTSLEKTLGNQHLDLNYPAIIYCISN
uniref:Uncharacterized protein n=1 Tax=Arundo donax TaxID=35708 RepID=A0A0A9AY58_ARUDO